MDAGLAGLIGALGGAVVGAAGASVAAVIALRGARYQADRQRQAGHEQWLRQIRREAYAAFLLHAREAYSLCCGVDPPSSAELVRVEAAIEGMRTTMGTLLLEAPEHIQKMAEVVYTQTRNIHGRAVRPAGLDGPTLERRRIFTMRLFSKTYRELVEACRQSLQDAE
ncbi:hypothetical protein ACWGBY_10045 [Streptomyces griseus]|uniref:hypothetical protein n=1 Tax=Streptomyces TaxID=1883 RepID=UPI0012FF42EE|nr:MULTISPECIES: hypothetical protein [Streptomyces]WUC91914.1 hypothetical protein OHQ35_37980 [Streptomyces anulatus]